jgi:hypothetical protein
VISCEEKKGYTIGGELGEFGFSSAVEALKD